MADSKMESMNIQWFPGHMTKARRMMEENVKLVDAVCEILDARIPNASRNPEIDRLAAGKPRLVILNRIDLADPDVTGRWRQYFEKQGFARMLEEEKVTDRTLLEAVREVFENREKYVAAMEKSEMRDAIAVITGLIEELGSASRHGKR